MVSRAAVTALLFLCALTLAACSNASTTQNAGQENQGTTAQTIMKPGATGLGTTGLGSTGATTGHTGAGSTGEKTSKDKTSKEEKASEKRSKEKTEAAKSGSGGSGETTVKGVLPKDVLSKRELTEVPKFSNWNDKSPDAGSSKLVPQGSSAGAIPDVRPFNFGRDPGGPDDKTLYLTVPAMGLSGVPVYNSTSEEDLTRSTVHVPATGFPWQRGANVYIAGHRIGYTGSGSLYIFYDLDKLEKGDEILLKDSKGGAYYYRVYNKEVVEPDNVEVMNPVDGKSVVTLQSCTLPHYKKRLIVQGELVEKKPS